MIKIRTALVAATTVAAATAFASPAPAATPKPKVGFYNCFAFSGGPTYQYTFQFKAGNKYVHGYGGEGTKINSPSKGTYSQKGSKITFKGGRMSKTFLKIKKHQKQKYPVLAVYAQGDTTSGIECQYRGKDGKG